MQRTKSLLRHLGLGHMRNMGAELPYRRRVEFMLLKIFGATFEKESFWYGRPNPDAFFAVVMNLAGAKVEVTVADGSQIFKLKPGTTSYEVNRSKLRALGVSEKTLKDLFAHTPAADERYQLKPVQTLLVPAPKNVAALANETYDDAEDDEDFEDQEDAARLLSMLGGSPVPEDAPHRVWAEEKPVIKKHASGSRPSKRARADQSVKESASSDKSDRTKLLEELGAVVETASKKIATSRSARSRVKKNKGKELLEDDDEPDDAVPAAACEDDGGDMHTLAMQQNMARNLRLKPRDNSHQPQRLMDYDFGFDLQSGEKRITEAEFADCYEFIYEQEGTSEPRNCSENEFTYSQDLLDFVTNACRSDDDRSSTVVSLDLSIGNLREDLKRWLVNTPNEQKKLVMEQLEQLHQTALACLQMSSPRYQFSL